MSLSDLHIPVFPMESTLKPRVLGELEKKDSTLQGFTWHTFLLEGAALIGTPEAMDNAYGRSSLYRIQELVIRPYLRGGALRFFNKDCYTSPKRFRNEWLIHSALYRAGFPTTKPMGYGYRSVGMGLYKGLYFSERAQAMPWPSNWILDKDEINGLVKNLLTLCKWGIWSPDLNATNILKDPSLGILFMDWDLARVSTLKPQYLLDRYKNRLLRSLEKLEAPSGIRSIINNISWTDPHD